ncbi:MAG: polyprenyl diphosphate synthase [Deltaproteobacteria bacterium]
MSSETELLALRREVMEAGVPRHVAIIMDGNGRWAEARGMARVAGHREGSESVRAVTREARRIGLSALTVYAFSAQNWQRPEDEVVALMELLREYLLKERAELWDNQIRLQAAGDIERLPPHVQEPLRELSAHTATQPTKMTLTLALSYGSREELVHAARRLADEGVAPGEIDEAALGARLWTHGLPDPDLVIRTGGEHRLSNFLLWQAAYAELCFVETAWPEFRERELLLAVRDYQRRERRFGKTSAQVVAQQGTGLG